MKIKRPLALACLVLSAVILIISKVYEIDHINSDEGYIKHENSVVLLTGQVSDIVLSTPAAIKLKNVRIDNESECSKGALCYLDTPIDPNLLPKIGSVVKVSGKLYDFEEATNPGEFDLKTYHKTEGVWFGLKNTSLIYESTSYSRIRNFLFRVRFSLSAILDTALPQKEASIVKTMILGDKSTLDKKIKELYQKNGLSHILAISGLHISMIGLGIYKLLILLRLKGKSAAFISSFFIILYGYLTGMSPSAQRAVVMFIVSMAAVILKRSFDPMTALSLSFCILLFINPLNIKSTGFILTFAYILGFILTEDLFKLPRGPLKYPVSLIKINLISLPIYSWFFYSYPIYFSIINLVIIPFVSIIILSAFVLMFLYKICAPLSFPLRSLICGILFMYEKTASIASGLPLNHTILGRPRPWQMAVYILIFVFIFIYKKKLTSKAKIIMIFTGVLTILIRIHPPFELILMDVGQGDGIFLRSNESLITFPWEDKSLTVLVDSGSTTVKEVGKYKVIPCLKYLGVSKIDAMIATHPDTDHTNGLIEIMDNSDSEGFTIGSLYVSDTDYFDKDDSFLELISHAEKENIPIRKMHENETVENENLRLICTSVRPNTVYSSLNEASIVLYGEAKNLSFLLTGDIEGEGEKILTKTLCDKNISDIDILKCAHHGSKNSTSDDFLATVRPKITIISCGKNNPYNHPHEETLDRLKKYGSRIIRTDISGCIYITQRYPGFFQEDRKYLLLPYRNLRSHLQ